MFFPMSRFFRFFHRLSINVSASWQRNVVSHTTSAAPFHAQKFNRLKNKNPNLQNAKCKSNVGRDCLLPHIWHTHTHTLTPDSYKSMKHRTPHYRELTSPKYLCFSSLFLCLSLFVWTIRTWAFFVSTLTIIVCIWFFSTLLFCSRN